jgi:hypothetical protein
MESNCARKREKREVLRHLSREKKNLEIEERISPAEAGFGMTKIKGLYAALKRPTTRTMPPTEFFSKL